ncbi:MAG: threonine/serine dehydratase, partial [Pseudomonadota bacterium]
MTDATGTAATPQIVSADGVFAAADRLDGIAVRTPLIESPLLNEKIGGRVLLKAEALQHYGSFKIRGAYNLMAQLPEETRARGVVAWSSGNHAQGVAYAARLLGCPATIVMPADAPAVKRDNVLALGAEIVPYDRYTEDREAIARDIAAADARALAPSYDHPHVIEGQGTVALETFEQASALGVELDGFIACCGGGGLAAGCATILEAISPGTEIFIAEPEGYDEFWASIKEGERQVADVSRPTLCDAIATPTPGALTLPILARRCVGGASLSDQEVAEAMAFAFNTLKIVIEPGGAVALAALPPERVAATVLPRASIFPVSKA